MQYAKDLLNRAKELAVQTAQDFRASSLASASADGRVESPPRVPSPTSLSTATVVQSVEVRVARFQTELRGSRINLDNLKRLAFHGIPDKGNLRAVVWKLLLGYLPLCPEDWSSQLARRRTQYHVFCDELIVDPKKPSGAEQAAAQAAALASLALESANAPLGASARQGASRGSSSGGGGSALGAAAGHGGSGGGGLPAAGLGAVGGPLQADGGAGGGGGGSGGGAAGAVAHGSANGGSAVGLAGGAGPQAVAVASNDPLGAHPLEPVDDHPLCLEHTSKWNTYFKDSEIMIQVERDVMRTHPDMAFFTGDSPEAEAHREDMKRALFMYAKLNPGLRYIQGMNELIAPLYYLFKTDCADPLARTYAEADAFWCFMELISDFRDHFCAQLDNAATGIKATLRRLMAVLAHHDRQLWHHIEIVHKVDPQFYAFRWVTLLLSQEFSFPDVLRIWDTVLSDPHGRMDCMMRICTAMILNVKPRLMQGDFTVILKTLQRYPPVDINVLLQRAAEMPPCRTILGAEV